MLVGLCPARCYNLPFPSGSPSWISVSLGGDAHLWNSLAVCLRASEPGHAPLPAPVGLSIVGVLRNAAVFLGLLGPARRLVVDKLSG